jgi:hypothetical protein
MKTFTITIVDSLRYKVLIHLEGANKATLELGLNATLGMAGCEILKIEEYTPTEF